MGIRTWPDGSISRHCEDCRFMYECEQCGKESERFGDGDVEDEGWGQARTDMEGWIGSVMNAFKKEKTKP